MRAFVLCAVLVPCLALGEWYQRGMDIRDLPASGQWAAKGWIAITSNQAAQLLCEQAGGSWSNGECVYSPPPVVDPVERAASIQANDIPTLTNHPSSVPPGGVMYRLIEGTNVTWWVLRAHDAIATQLSAHDEQGRSIIRSRNIRTGVETRIDIEQVAPSTNMLDSIRLDLRTLKGSLATNNIDAKAIAALTNGFTAAENRATVNALRRELIDLINDVQALRRAQAQTVKEINP